MVDAHDVNMNHIVNIKALIIARRVGTTGTYFYVMSDDTRVDTTLWRRDTPVPPRRVHWHSVLEKRVMARNLPDRTTTTVLTRKGARNVRRNITSLISASTAAHRALVICLEPRQTKISPLQRVLRHCLLSAGGRMLRTGKKSRLATPPTNPTASLMRKCVLAAIQGIFIEDFQQSTQELFNALPLAFVFGVFFAPCTNWWMGVLALVVAVREGHIGSAAVKRARLLHSYGIELVGAAGYKGMQVSPCMSGFDSDSETVSPLVQRVAAHWKEQAQVTDEIASAVIKISSHKWGEIIDSVGGAKGAEFLNWVVHPNGVRSCVAALFDSLLYGSAPEDFTILDAVAADPIVEAVFGKEVSLYQVARGAAEWAAWMQNSKKNKPPEVNEEQESRKRKFLDRKFAGGSEHAYAEAYRLVHGD